MNCKKNSVRAKRRTVLFIIGDEKNEGDEVI